MEKILLRASGIQQFVSCPRQWYNVHILGIKIRPRAASRAGTSLHKASEIGYTEYLKNKQLAPVQDCVDAGIEEWRTLFKEEEPILDEGTTSNDIEKLVQMGIVKYYAEIMSNDPDEVQGVEERFELMGHIIDEITFDL